MCMVLNVADDDDADGQSSVAGRLCVKERRAAQQFVVRLAHADWILRFLRHIIITSNVIPRVSVSFLV